MEWVAIDFETANSDRASACALGLVSVQDGQVAKRQSWLIRPLDPYFDPYNVMIHGITEDDVADSPTFAELWDEIYSEIEGRSLVAHNASFDMSVLRHTLDGSDLPYPALDYYCTRVISQALWKTLPSYGLECVSDHLGIAFQHHIAVEDAMACAAIALHGISKVGVSDLAELAERLSVRGGHLHPGGYQACRLKISSASIESRVKKIDPEHSFGGKIVVFTGELRSMVRKEAQQLTVDHGGRITETLRKDTNFLVVGDSDFRKFRSGQKSSKLLKAESLRAAGADIEILSEEEWLQLLDPALLKAIPHRTTPSKLRGELGGRLHEHKHPSISAMLAEVINDAVAEALDELAIRPRPKRH